MIVFDCPGQKPGNLLPFLRFREIKEQCCPELRHFPVAIKSVPVIILPVESSPDFLPFLFKCESFFSFPQERSKSGYHGKTGNVTGSGGKGNGSTTASVPVAPVAVSEINQSVFLKRGAERHVPHDRRIIFHDITDFAGKAIKAIRNFKYGAVPDWPAAGIISPAGRRNDPRKLSGRSLTVPHGSQPFGISFRGIEIVEPRIRCKHCISGPSVFFAMGAIGGNSNKVGTVGTYGQQLKTIKDRIAGNKSSDARKVGSHLAGSDLQQFHPGIGFDFNITEAMVDKTRLPFFGCPRSSQNIAVGLIFSGFDEGLLVCRISMAAGITALGITEFDFCAARARDKDPHMTSQTFSGVKTFRYTETAHRYRFKNPAGRCVILP